MILVTSAGGKTGRAMIAAFAAAGEPVRAMMRHSEKDEELIALGAAEVSHGDLANTGDVTVAAEGCRAIYYICPNMIENEMDIGGNVIDAAKATQVDRLIFHSVLHTQVQALQHDADVCATKAVEFCCRHGGEILARDDGTARARPQDAGEDVQQRRLAAARRPQHQPLLALRGAP